HPVPAARALGAFSFPSVEAGWSAMREMFQEGLRPAVARLYDPFDSMIARMGAVRRARRAASGPTPEKKPRARRGPGGGALALRSALRVPGLINKVVDVIGSRVVRGANLVLIFEGPADQGSDDLSRAAAIATRLGARPLGEEPARH